jgi:acyl-CoA hydrolase
MKYSNLKSITKSFAISIKLAPNNLTSSSLTNWLLSELDNLVWLSYCKLWGHFATNCVTKSIDNFKLTKALKSGKLVKIQSIAVLLGSKSFEFYFNIMQRNERLNEWEL